MKRYLPYIIGAFIVILAVVLFFVLKNKQHTVYDDEVEEDDLTYSDAEYQQFAEILWRALKPLNEDEDTIYHILRQMKNKSDWYKLMSVYGTDGSGYSLLGHLKADLDNSEFQEVRDILSHINVIV
jgi:hypothetical protein